MIQVISHITSQKVQSKNFWLLEHISSSKEKDMETGYSYFGARYYDSDVSLWLSVDPMADKYPSMSPFMYTAGNPVMLIDPNGMETIKMDDEFGINGEKISDYGGEKTDYHHQKNGTVVIKDHKSGKEKGSMPVGAFYAGKSINNTIKSDKFMQSNGSSDDDYSNVKAIDILIKWQKERNEYESKLGGTIYSVGLSSSIAAGILGYDAEKGILLDFRDGFSVASFNEGGVAAAADASPLGIKFTSYNANTNSTYMDFKTLNGMSDNFNFGVGPFDISYGGNSSNKGLWFNSATCSPHSYWTYSTGASFSFTNMSYTQSRTTTVVGKTIKFW